MKYYLYMSDSKVDMLLPQVPGALKQTIATKLGFDIKILSGEIGTQRRTHEDRVARLATVDRYITSNYEPGSLGEDSPWVCATAFARIACLDEKARVVFFLVEKGNFVLAMGGSTVHLIGNAQVQNLESGFSFTHRLLEEFQRVADTRPEFLVMPHDFRTGVVWSKKEWFQVVLDAVRRIDGPLQNISFLAKRLLSGVHNDKTIMLGTPLYVALED